MIDIGYTSASDLGTLSHLRAQSPADFLAQSIPVANRQRYVVIESRICGPKAQPIL